MLRCDILIICQPFHFTSVHFDTSDMVKHASGLSNTEGEIMALRNFALPWGNHLRLAERGKLEEAWQLQKWACQFLTKVFYACFFMIEFCGWGRGKERPETDLIQTLCWCSQRWSVWHFDTASVDLDLVHQRLFNQKEGGTEHSIWVYGSCLTDGKWILKLWAFYPNKQPSWK